MFPVEILISFCVPVNLYSRHSHGSVGVGVEVFVGVWVYVGVGLGVIQGTTHSLLRDVEIPL